MHSPRSFAKERRMSKSASEVVLASVRRTYRGFVAERHARYQRGDAATYGLRANALHNPLPNLTVVPEEILIDDRHVCPRRRPWGRGLGKRCDS
jgi:hypothetical protein